ncbi:MAG: hypothetical protein ACK52S_21845 [Pirellula sp.]|jgi:hypothetical protein
MTDMIEAIERHLGRVLTTDQLDYYAVLGLEPFCEDEKKIRTAMQAAIATYKSSNTQSYPESSNKVAKLLKQAQAILLDAEKRGIYDAQLRKMAAAKLKAAKVVAHVSAGVESRSWFPEGDPMAPVTLAGLESTFASSTATEDSHPDWLAQIQDADHRRSELLLLFPSLAMMSTIENDEHSSGLESFGKGVRSKLAKASSTASGDSMEATVGVSLLEQMRRKRRQRQLMAVGGMIVAAAGLLGFATYKYIDNQRQVAARLADKDQKKSNRFPGMKDSGSSNQAPVGSSPSSGELELGLKGPKGRGDVGGPALPKVNRPDSDNEVSADAKGDMQAKDPAEMAAPEKTMEPKPEVPMTPEPATTPAPVTPAPETPASPVPQPTPEVKPPMATMESKEWVGHMENARMAIDKLEFDKFDTSIQAANETAMTAEGKAKAARLDQMGQLYKIYIDAFAEAKKKAKGTSSIKVGSAEFSIVESTPDKVIVRAQGKNQTHEWGKLPFGMAVAFSDLGLSDKEPVDIAARAVFFSLAPNYRESAQNNDIVKKRIAGWLEKSLGKGSVRQDLMQALSDKYE